MEYFVTYGMDKKFDPTDKKKQYNLADTIKKCHFIDRKINDNYKLISKVAGFMEDTGD